MLLMDLSNNQISGINLEAIKDENWFGLDEWDKSSEKEISQETYSPFNWFVMAKLTKILINFIVSRKIPLVIWTIIDWPLKIH